MVGLEEMGGAVNRAHEGSASRTIRQAGRQTSRSSPSPRPRPRPLEGPPHSRWTRRLGPETAQVSKTPPPQGGSSWSPCEALEPRKTHVPCPGLPRSRGWSCDSFLLLFLWLCWVLVVACGIFLDQGWNPCTLHWQTNS